MPKMPPGPRRTLSLALLAAGSALAAHASVGPDVTVYQLTDIGNYGAFNGVRAYAIGTTSWPRASASANNPRPSRPCTPVACASSAITSAP